MRLVDTNTINYLNKAAHDCEAEHTLNALHIYKGAFDTYAMAMPDIVVPEHPEIDVLLKHFCKIAKLNINLQERFLPLIARKILQYLAEPTTAKKLTDDQDGLRILGWFIVSQASKIFRNMNSIHHDRLRTVVAGVNGGVSAENLARNTEEIFVALYGQACWDLYSLSDTTDDSALIEVAAELYTAGIPLLAEQKRNRTQHPPQQLPDTLLP